MDHSSDAQRASIAELVPEINRLTADAMAELKTPGAAIAVVQDGKVVLTKAYGQRDVEATLPVTPATQFVIASITKSFTATAVALLHEEGRLDWTKPVRDYLPEFRLHDPLATERLTILDLLTHQSGLPRHDWVYLPGDLAPAELLGLMRYLEPNRDFRAAHEYNNLGYNLLGLLIERVSGQSYDAFIRARLADKLGMTVGFNLDDLEASADAARPYMVQEGTRLAIRRLPFRAVAAGAITASADGLANWMLLHLGKGEFNGERLLPATLINSLHTPRVHYQQATAEFGDAHYGLGLRCQSYRGDRVVFHGGGLPGWGAMMALVPDFGIGVAVLTNRSPNEGVAGPLTWHIIDRLRGREPIDWFARGRKLREQAPAQMQAWKTKRENDRHPDTQPAHDLSAYAGDYEHPAYGMMSIEERDHTLHWSWRGMSATMTHRHYETFELPEGLHPLLPYMLPITFLTDREGNIVSLSTPLEPAVKDIVFVRAAAGDR